MGKHLEDISDNHVVSLMHRILTSSRGNENSSTGFEPDRGRRQQELTNDKNIKGKYHVRNMLKEVFGLAEHQEKATYGLGF